MLTEKGIQKALLSNFYSHKYKFINVYYFHNESDWLSFLPSGFCYEVEVKISRADFKKDFSKPRHEIHTKKNNGSKFFISKQGIDRCFDPSWELCKAFPELIESRERPLYGRRHGEIEVILYMDMSSKIEIKSENNKYLPNKFFYAVPEGLVSKDEVPEYAGLLYVTSEGKVKKVKDGKFIHKDKLQPEKVFQKTYYAYESKLVESLR